MRHQVRDIDDVVDSEDALGSLSVIFRAIVGIAVIVIAGFIVKASENISTMAIKISAIEVTINSISSQMSLQRETTTRDIDRLSSKVDSNEKRIYHIKKQVIGANSRGSAHSGMSR